jgi:ABC-type uncharacterized transport system auxiliary subunit
MNTPRAWALLAGAIAASLAPGCALLSKGDQGAARYFSLDRASDSTPPAAVPAAAPGGQPDPAELRLGRITGAPHLEERLVFRSSRDEVDYYRERRWTEPPQKFLERRLARVLFEERGLRQVVGGPAPTLDVTLTAFDEIRAPEHVARAQVVARLHDDRVVLWEATLAADRPVAAGQGRDPARATVDAFGEALQAVVDGLADRVVQALQEHR